MKKIDWSRVLQILEQHERFVLTTHVHPDGDGLGAQVALHRYLTGCGKEAVICNKGRSSPRYAHLERIAPVEWVGRDAARERLDWAEVILVLDTSDATRLGPIGELLDNFKGSIVAIDHHLFDHGVSPLTIRDPEASSTGELVHDLFRTVGHPIDPETAEALFTSLVTDTGWLRFEKTTPEVLHMAAGLVEAGAHPYDLFSRIHDVQTWSGFDAQTQILQTAHPAFDGQVAIAVIDHETFLRARPDSGSAEEILNAMLSIVPVEVAILLTEVRTDYHRVSLRSRGRINVAEIAASLGGGGHHNSSGTQLPGDPTQVERTVLEALRPSIS